MNESYRDYTPEELAGIRQGLADAERAQMKAQSEKFRKGKAGMKNINLHFDGEVTSTHVHVVDRFAESMTRLGVNYDFYGITQEIAQAFLESVCGHVMNVRTAGHAIGVNDKQMREHDSSKFSMDEFPHYARQFHGDKSDPNGFACAWLNHIHCNPHHWQHWMFPDGFSPRGSTVENGVVRMPDEYVMEMVADWMGASLSYTGSGDMTEWLTQNLPKIKLHSASWESLKIILRNSPCGYNSILDELQVNGLIP